MNFLKKLLKKTTKIQTTLNITSSNGFHLRPIAKFVNEVKKFEAMVELEAKGQTVTATQVPKILSLSLEKGETFTLICSGKEAEKASNFLSSYFEKLMREDKEVAEIVQEKSSYTSKSIQGKSISKGTGVGVLTSYYKKTTYIIKMLCLLKRL